MPRRTANARRGVLTRLARGAAEWREQLGNRSNSCTGRHLTYSVSSGGGSLSAVFSDITNLTRNAVHSTPAVRFTSVGTDSSGAFSQGIQGNRIQGAFYGSSFEEIAGTFERFGVFAAYGTLKDGSFSQPPEPDTGSTGEECEGSESASPPASSPVEDAPESSSAAHTRASFVKESVDSFLMSRAILRSKKAKWVPYEFGVRCSSRTCTMSPGSYSADLWTELTRGDADITLK